ncbi:FadR/GntR family transcriptional regulator [Leucobacter aridicollis]|uniref:FadR/GntR family transcriptional regulator n=1 Tax=Leucobacter aridicollis TaxID=283878 RepID=UPI00210617B4|nr:FCD domain-containing protein [Leucobacter aridicollis]UTX54045.1 FadR family transcriptional regulator [Leucobacter aridicollis]
MDDQSRAPLVAAESLKNHHFSLALLNDPPLNALVELLLGMAPGERLASERELTQTLNLSRNTLRDRMSKLESMGVLSRKERQGTFYTGVQPEQTGDVLILGLMFQQMTVESLISVRHALERQAAIEACVNADDAALAALEDSLSRMHGTQDGKELLEADGAFHRAMFAASGSPGLIFFSEMLQPVLQGTLQHLTLEQDFETMRKVHDDIFTAVRAGDVARASATVDDHFAWLDVLTERERDASKP